MFGRLFLLFTLIPIIELYTLVQVGSVIGGWTTVGIVIFTGAVGAWLARMEGMATMLRVRESLHRGAMPADEMVEGVLILVAGIVLLTPGFMTDAMGLLLLFPPTRKPIAKWLRRQFSESARIHAQRSGGQTSGTMGSTGNFAYYSWSSGGEQTIHRVDHPRHSREEPRQAVVIDCEAMDEKK